MRYNKNLTYQLVIIEMIIQAISQSFYIPFGLQKHKILAHKDIAQVSLEAFMNDFSMSFFVAVHL